MSLPRITPDKARQLLDEGAILVDVREADEHARERIAGAQHLPLSRLAEAELAAESGQSVIFHCRSGARTLAHAPRLAEKVNSSCEAYVVDGGLDAWKRAGLPVVANARAPLELQRQVQISAGVITFLGVLLGVFVSPWLFAIPAFVGLGLTFAGATGRCGLASALRLAPWNKAFRATRTA